MLTADQLQASILQEAIQGKLVPQLDSEPAVDQVGEIPEDVPFSIPEKWKWIRLDLVQTLIRGLTFPKEAKQKIKTINCIRCLTTGSVQNVYNEKADVFIDRIFLKNNKKILQRGDIIISSANSKELVGKSIKWDGNSEECSFGGFLTVARIKLGIINEDFLFIFYKYLFLLKIFQAISTQTTNIANLSNRVISNLLIPIPPLKEQYRIVSQVKKLMALIETYGKHQEQLSILEENFPNKLRASLLQIAIQGKLVPQFVSEPAVEQIGEIPAEVPFSIPEKWKWVILTSCVEINPKVDAPNETMATFLTMSCISEGYKNSHTIGKVNRWGEIKSGHSRFREGDVLLAKITPCFQNMKSAIASDLKSGIGCGSTEFHVLRCSTYIDAEYLLFFLKSPFFIEYGVNHFRGTAGQLRLGTKDLKECCFPLPPISEQRRIVSQLKKLILLVGDIAKK
jgi:type I restriction enzyme S subunit